MNHEALFAKIDFLEILARGLRREVFQMCPTDLASLPAPDPATPRAEEIARRPRMISRILSEDRKNQVAREYAFLAERERVLEQEEVELKRKYQDLQRAIREERAALREEQQRLFRGLQYGILEEPEEAGEILQIE